MATLAPLTDPSPAALAEAIPANLFALFRAMTGLPGSERLESEALCYHHAFPSNPMFKGIWRARLAPDSVDDSIEQALAWFTARQAPFAFWWVDPATQPADLPARLEAYDFMPNVVGDPGMAADLHALDETLASPDRLEIRVAGDRPALEDWRDVFCASYEVPAFAGQAWVDATLRFGADQAPWQLYTGYLNDRPVACNILFNGAGVASVYGVGTVPDARGNGFGAAITLRPLLDARAQGYRFGVLYATEMGAPVYRRMGFNDVDCAISRYLWRNPA